QHLLHSDDTIHPQAHRTTQRIRTRQTAFAKHRPTYVGGPVEHSAERGLQAPNRRTRIDRVPGRIASRGRNASHEKASPRPACALAPHPLRVAAQNFNLAFVFELTHTLSCSGADSTF